jgi:preprotein translocase subunit SecG
METTLRVFQVLLAFGLIGVVLLQRSEGGGLGVGSSGGMGSFMSVRGTANFLTRVTSILGGLFMITCLALALIAHPAEAPRSIFDVPASTLTMPAPPASEAPPLPIPAPGEKPADSSGAPTAGGATTETAPSAPAASIPTLPAVPPVAATPAPSTPALAAPVATTPKGKAPAAKTKKPSHAGASQPSGQ